MKKTLLLLSTLFMCIFLSCSFQNSEENSSLLSFSIGRELIQKLACSSVKYTAPEDSELYMRITLSGKYEDSAEVPVADGSTVTFSGIPAGSSLVAEALVYKKTERDLSEGTAEEPLYVGKSQVFSVKPGKNTISLVLKKIISVNLYDTGSIFYKTVYVHKGECLDEPEPPHRESSSEEEAYIFSGWYMTEPESTGSDSSGKEFDFSTPIAETINLYAKWTVIKASIAEDDLSEIEVTMTKEDVASADGCIYTFTADSAYDSYTWKIDGEASDIDGAPFGSTNIFTFNTLERARGTYDITLLATKTVDSKVKHYSFRRQIVIE